MHKFRYWNLEALLQTILLFSIAVYFAYLLYTQKYLAYIHPNYRSLLLLSLPCFFLCALFQARKITSPRHRQKARMYGIYLLPLLFLLLGTESLGLGSTDIFGEASYPGFVEIKKEAVSKVAEKALDTTKEDLKVSALSTGGQALSLGDTVSDDPAEQVPAFSGAISVTNLHYAKWLQDVFNDPDAYVGKTYTFLGRVRTSEYALGNYVLLGRPIMLCCAADSQVMGLFAQLPKDLKADGKEWYYFTATVEKTTGVNRILSDKEMPVLNILHYEEATRPQSPFAYYFVDQAWTEVVNP